MTVSSADFKKYLLLYLFVQWFVYKIYNKGDKSQLCGELVDVVKEADKLPFTNTLGFLSTNQLN